MARETKTAFELETLIIADMIAFDECPIGIAVKVKSQGDEDWTATSDASDPACAGRVSQIAAKLRSRFDLKP